MGWIRTIRPARSAVAAVTHKPRTDWWWLELASLAMLIVCLGFCEHIYGTPAACRLFFLCHLTILTIISISVILLAEIHPSSSVDALMNGRMRPVGWLLWMSRCTSDPNSRLIKQASFTILIVILLVRLSASLGHLPSNPATVSADFAHLSHCCLGNLVCLHLKP